MAVGERKAIIERVLIKIKKTDEIVRTGIGAERKSAKN